MRVALEPSQFDDLRKLCQELEHHREIVVDLEIFTHGIRVRLERKLPEGGKLTVCRLASWADLSLSVDASGQLREHVRLAALQMSDAS